MAIQGSQDLTKIRFRSSEAVVQTREADFDAFENIDNADILGDLPDVGNRIAIRCENVAALTSLNVQNGDLIQLLGYYTAGDGGGQALIYRRSGRLSITIDNGFYFNGSGDDDYFEAVDKTVANVRRFGAKGDGVTDDSGSIQTALDSGVGKIYIPDGTYIVGKSSSGFYSLNVPSEVQIIGAGRSSTVIKLVDSPSALTRIFLIDGKNSITIKDFTIDGNYTTLTPSYEQYHGIIIDNSVKILIENIEFKNCGGDGVLIMGSSGECEDVTVSKCRFSACQRNGVTLYNGYYKVRVIDNYFENTIVSTAIDSEPTAEGINQSDVIVTGNIIESTSTSHEGITIGGVSPTTPTRRWVVSDNMIYGCVRAINAEDIIISNNPLIAPEGSPAPAGIYLFNYSNRVSIENNNVVVSGIPGIYVLYSTTIPENTIIRGNVVSQSGNAEGIISRGSDYVTISDNMVGGVGLNNGIYLFATRSMIGQSISNNTVKNFTRGLKATHIAPNAISGMLINGNTFDDDQATATQTIAMDLLSTANWITGLIIGANIIGPDVTTPLSIHTGTLYSLGSATKGIAHYCGGGSPESVVTAPIGSTYVRRDGGVGTTLYIKESGNGNIGWTAK